MDGEHNLGVQSRKRHREPAHTIEGAQKQLRRNSLPILRGSFRYAREVRLQESSISARSTPNLIDDP